MLNHYQFNDYEDMLQTVRMMMMMMMMEGQQFQNIFDFTLHKRNRYEIYLKKNKNCVRDLN